MIMLTWSRSTKWAVNFCFKAGDERLIYFYDYFAREYREGRGDRLLCAPAAMFQGIKPEEVKNCRLVLKNAFLGYREGRNAEILKALLLKYQGYISGLHEEHAKNRYNVFVYRYMLEVPVGSRAIAAKLGVVKETIQNYINGCLDEMLVLCMGLPAIGKLPKEKEMAIRILINYQRLLDGMAEDDIFCLFPGKKERSLVEQGRMLTREVMEWFADAVEAYSDFCQDKQTRIATDIRKAEVLQNCLDGVSPAAIAEIYGCCESTVYADIRENEKRLSAMLFDAGKTMADAKGKRIWSEESAWRQ